MVAAQKARPGRRDLYAWAASSTRRALVSSSSSAPSGPTSWRLAGRGEPRTGTGCAVHGVPRGVEGTCAVIPTTVGMSDSASSPSIRGGNIGSVGSASSSTRSNRSNNERRHAANARRAASAPGRNISAAATAWAMSSLHRVAVRVDERVVDVPHLIEVDRRERLPAGREVVPVERDDLELRGAQRGVDSRLDVQVTGRTDATDDACGCLHRSEARLEQLHGA